MRNPLQQLVLLLLLFAAGATLSAQSTDEWYLDKPVREIVFKGLKNVPELELQGIVQPFLGQNLTGPMLDDLQRRLYAVDYFVWLYPDIRDPDGTRRAVILEFTVQERPIIGEIVITGERRVPEGAIHGKILAKLADFYVQAKVRTDSEAILQYYLSEGYPDVKVTFEVTDLPDGNKRVEFIIDEGPQASIRTIEFEGLAFGTPQGLKNVLTSKEQGLFNAGKYQVSSLDSDREAIINFYNHNGYIDAAIEDIRVDRILNDDASQASLILTYVIREGDPWNFGGLSISGNSVFSQDVLLRKLKLKPGDPLDLVTFRTNIQDMLGVYHEGGFFSNSFDFRETRDPETRTITYHLTIVERERSYIQNVIIRGNEKTADHVILRELPFESGEIFSSTKIREGLLNLYNLQYFEGVPIVETPQGSEPQLRDVIITLTEKQTMNLKGGFSVGGGGDFPLFLVAGLSDINFLGLGVNFGVDLNISAQTQSLAVNFSDAYLFGDRFGGGINLSLSHSQKTRIPQDFDGPVFFDPDDPQAVPDPFTGEYIVTKAGGGYSVGDTFVGTPTSADIETYGLVTDFVYAGGNAAIPSDYLMAYDDYSISLGLNLNIRRKTDIGWLGFGASLSTAFNIVDYDETKYRPFDAAIRSNLRSVQLENRLGLNLSLDTRDVFFNPSSGFYLSQGLGFTGGFLFGTRHFIRTDTTAQAFFTLAHAGEEPIGNWRLVLALNSSLSLMLPQFWTLGGENDNFVHGNNLLFTNGMTAARGWPAQTGGEALFNNWIELRMPIDENVLWFDTYFEAVRLTQDRDKIFAASNEGWMFGFGTGLRLSIPQLPLRLYLAKRFKIDDNGQIEWQDGNLFPGEPGKGGGIDFVLAISLF